VALPQSARLRRVPRIGQTLLELVLSIVILAGTLVPALRLMRRTLEYSRDIETRNAMVMYCTSKLDEHLVLASATWAAGPVAGNFAAQGSPELRYTVTRSDATTAGGIPDRLMAITVTVWHDANGNGSRDGNESAVALASKAAKLVGYQNEASGS